MTVRNTRTKIWYASRKRRRENDDDGDMHERKVKPSWMRQLTERNRGVRLKRNRVIRDDEQ